MDEHVLEAVSSRIPWALVHWDELWDRCYDELMAQVRERLEQEIARLGGHYAHVLDGRLIADTDDVTGEAWLHDRFTYMLYSRRA